MTTAAALPPPQSLDELRAQLLKLHGVTVSADDPILMVYTIHRVAVDEFADMLARHEQAHSQALEETSAKHREAVSRAVEEIASEVMSDTVRERLLAMQEAAITADRSQQAMRRHLRRVMLLTACSTLAAITATGALAFLLI
jgi:Na+-translocating ferredoxin:NAD+ oxidoreductase RnfC subunit